MVVLPFVSIGLVLSLFFRRLSPTFENGLKVFMAEPAVSIRPL